MPIGLSAKGVGSVIERLKRGIREQILGMNPAQEEDAEPVEKHIDSGTRIDLCGTSEYGTSTS